jgi:geranylgeranylglycerol-phosphate geranylgeranyltransferase
MVSFSVGMTFVFGGIVVDRPASFGVLWFGTIAALLDLGEEIAADAMDIEGDRAVGSRSLAVVYGRAVALGISAAIFGVVILVSLAPFALGVIEPVYLLPIAAMDVVILYSVIRLLNPGTANPRAHIRAIYLSGLGAVLVFIGIRLMH